MNYQARMQEWKMPRAPHLNAELKWMSESDRAKWTNEKNVAEAKNPVVLAHELSSVNFFGDHWPIERVVVPIRLSLIALFTVATCKYLFTVHLTACKQIALYRFAAGNSSAKCVRVSFSPIKFRRLFRVPSLVHVCARQKTKNLIPVKRHHLIRFIYFICISIHAIIHSFKSVFLPCERENCWVERKCVVSCVQVYFAFFLNFIINIGPVQLQVTLT